MNIKSLKSEYTWVALLSAAVTFVAIAIAQFPIGTDLPQHVAQSRLLSEHLEWPNPNSLVYWALIPFVKMFGPLWGIKSFLIFNFALCIVLFGRVANALKVPALVVPLFAALSFNASYFWGFLPFVVGQTVFLAFWLLLLNDELDLKLSVAAGLVISTFLAWTHNLWFAYGAVAGAVWVVFAPDKKRLLVLATSALPAAIWSLVSASEVAKRRAEKGFEVDPHWFFNVFERLTNNFAARSLFGELSGFVASGFLLLFVAVVGFLLNKSRVQPPTKHRLPTLVLAFVTVALFLFLPDKYLNSIEFSRRWGPMAMTLIVLSLFMFRSLPKPNLSVAFVPLFLVGSHFAYVSTKVQTTLTGLDESIAAITLDEPRVLGLTFLRYDKRLKGEPFLQTFAWSQAFHGGIVNFSFCEHQVGGVDCDYPIQWTQGLEWDAEGVTVRDLKYFDYVLVSGTEQKHHEFSAVFRLEVVQNSGYWRLYEGRRKR